MNIQEALKSGKPFKRSETKRWVKGDSDKCNFFDEDGWVIRFSKEDILAEDWITYEDEITTTRHELIKNWSEARKEFYTLHNMRVVEYDEYKDGISKIFSLFLKNMGFGELK